LIFSIHAEFLLMQTAPAVEASVPPVTAGHGKKGAFQAAAQPRPDDLAQITGHERDHPDVVSGHHFLQGPGNRTTDEHPHPHFGQTQRFQGRRFIGQPFLYFCDPTARLGLYDMNAPGDIKNRRDSIVPRRKCCFHHAPAKLRSYDP